MTRVFQRLRTACGKKIAYLSEAQASEKARYLRSLGSQVRPYLCEMCDYWHVGHYGYLKKKHAR